MEEQLIRNQQARGSNPLSGSTDFKVGSSFLGPFFMGFYILYSIVHTKITAFRISWKGRRDRKE